jgi:hypothetical protein
MIAALILFSTTFTLWAFLCVDNHPVSSFAFVPTFLKPQRYLFTSRWVVCLLSTTETKGIRARTHHIRDTTTDRHAIAAGSRAVTDKVTSFDEVLDQEVSVFGICNRI